MLNDIDPESQLQDSVEYKPMRWCVCDCSGIPIILYCDSLVISVYSWQNATKQRKLNNVSSVLAGACTFACATGCIVTGW